jgi:chemotaxis protein methyltransferase CheR
MDLVLIRNVLIYFSTETKREILRKVRNVMRPDGYALLGSSETTHFLDDAYQSVQRGSSVCYRLPEQASRAA